LECGRAVCHTEKHYKRFKRTVVSAKDNLSLIIRLDADIVELPVYIQLGVR